MQKYNLSKNKSNTISSEVETQAKRRSYSASYKRKILALASQCSRPGELGALLRQEGLRSSTLQGWRLAEANGRLRATKSLKRGVKAELNDSQKARLNKLEKENAALKRRLEQAEALVELQKKIAAVMSLTSPSYKDSK